MFRIAFLGPPGAGKGTQAALLAPVLGVPIVMPGALYRREIAAGTPLGKQVAAVVESGGMVPNVVTNGVIAARVAEPDCVHGFILDGYPRELEQLEALAVFAPPLTHAILLTINEEEIYRRLSDRLVCVCGLQFNRRELAIEPGNDAMCTACDGSLIRRKDDDPERIARRIAHYREQTEPVIAACRARGILLTIDGQRASEMVQQDIRQHLGVAEG
ncbi:nucleoside monophosphate kinase [Candidatus Uhrbacteria bacterium]|nr:nucleoside monophosphate kinase [Candidatus Uhrbacteria bacterium]